jgi:Zn-dependent protease with chaperone function
LATYILPEDFLNFYTFKKGFNMATISPTIEQLLECAEVYDIGNDERAESSEDEKQMAMCLLYVDFRYNKSTREVVHQKIRVEKSVIEMLSDSELKATMLHEVGHIANRDAEKALKMEGHQDMAIVDDIEMEIAADRYALENGAEPTPLITGLMKIVKKVIMGYSDNTYDRATMLRYKDIFTKRIKAIRAYELAQFQLL